MIILMQIGSSSAANCPLAPPARRTVHARTLHRACLVLGGLAQLAAHLKTSESELRGWLEARELPPEPVFLAALEIILLDIERASGQAS